jgi:hypothetical protein
VLTALPAGVGFWLRLWLPESPHYLAHRGRLEPEATPRLAAAAGALNVTRHGLGSGRRHSIELIAERIEVRPLEGRARRTSSTAWRAPITLPCVQRPTARPTLPRQTP